MAVTLASLRAAHPEFTDTPDAVVQAGIDSAEARLSEDELEDLYDEAVTWLACDLIYTSPYSRDKRSSRTAAGLSYYYQRFEEIAEPIGRSERVVP
jgi:hypothetical protein